MSVRTRFDAALLDLDGTLLDTGADLARATNRMLAAVGLAERDPAELVTYIGRGIPRLVHRALTGDMQADAEAALAARALAAFEHAYAEESGRAAAIYPGVVEGLGAMRAAGVRLAVVTNKARRFTLGLLESSGLAPYFEAVVCGDDRPCRKPHPDPLLFACGALAAKPARTVMIGDSENDAQAGRAAGCAVLCVPYGYNEGRPVESIDCDAIVPDIAAAAGWMIDAAVAAAPGRPAAAAMR